MQTELTEFIQVGSYASRKLDSSFERPVPIYIKARHAGQQNEVSGRTIEDELNNIDVIKLLEDRFKQYVDGCKKAGISLSA